MGPQDDSPYGAGPAGDGTESFGHTARSDQPQSPDVHPNPPGDAPASEPGGRHRQPPSRGSMRFQDPATARPRPPTVGEARARDKAERKLRELEKARAEAELKRRQRNRRLKSSVVAVGVVGVVAGLGYWALSPRTTNAQCVQEDASGGPIIVPDSYCSGSPGASGIFLLGGHQYRYYYGSSGAVGSRPMGGTTVRPSNTTIKTSSGTTIQRGGFGSKVGLGGGS